MPDDKSKNGSPDRERVAGGEGYEVRYFANKHGLTHEQAHRLIQGIGHDRDELDAAAERVKRRLES